jgi:hypothetical protein
VRLPPSVAIRLRLIERRQSMHNLHRIVFVLCDHIVIVSAPICEVPFETTRRVVLQANCIATILPSYLNLLKLNGYVMHQQV